MCTMYTCISKVYFLPQLDDGCSFDWDAVGPAPSGVSKKVQAQYKCNYQLNKY